MSAIVKSKTSTESKIGKLQENCKYDKQLVNKKSKTIKKEQKNIKVPRSKTLNILEDDGPSLAAFTTRNQDCFK